MENLVVHGIKIFGVFIIPDPIDPAEPNTKLQQATPLNPAISCGNVDNQKKKEEEEEEEPQPPKPVIRRLTIKFGGGNSGAHNPLITPELRCLVRSIDVSEHRNPTHILTRTLFDSDVKKSMARLTLPRKQILMGFLSEREERLLGEHDSDGKPKGVKVVWLILCWWCALWISSGGITRLRQLRRGTRTSRRMSTVENHSARNQN